MTAPSAIKAYHQREERYQGLELEYDGSAASKQMILDAVETVSQKQGIAPMLNQFSDASIYLEFHDEYDREGGTYFTELLCLLGIGQCENS